MTACCLSCELPVNGELIQNSFHPECSRKLFGTSIPPVILFSTPELSMEAQRMAGKMSVSGVQPKLSVVYDLKKKCLKVVAAGGRYILKPQTERFPFIPENENVCMIIAGDFGLETPPHSLIPLADSRLAFIIRRFDRPDNHTKQHMEDFQQLLEKKNKYDGSYEQISKFIKTHSNTSDPDLNKLFERAVIFFVLGNGDAHLKNFSFIYTENIGYHLSPVYDVVNSRLVIPEEREEMCLSIRGKKNRITRNDFIQMAEHFGLNENRVFSTFERLINLQPVIEQRIEHSFLPAEYQKRFIRIFRERIERLHNCKK